MASPKTLDPEYAISCNDTECRRPAVYSAEVIVTPDLVGGGNTGRRLLFACSGVTRLAISSGNCGQRRREILRTAAIRRRTS